MDEAPPTRARRGLVVGATLAVVALLGLVIAGALLVSRGDSSDARTAHGSAARAVARLDANGGTAYVGNLGEASDAAGLRRTVRAELRSHDTRSDAPDGRARRCADVLRGASDGHRGRVVLLADATLSGATAVVVGIADHRRVVVFVVDATTCEVRSAQSL